MDKDGVAFACSLTDQTKPQPPTGRPADPLSNLLVTVAALLYVCVKILAFGWCTHQPRITGLWNVGILVNATMREFHFERAAGCVVADRVQVR